MPAALLQFAANLLLFAVPNVGLGWWLARRTPLAAVERLWLALFAGITISGMVVFLGYVAAAPLALNLLPTVAGLALALPAARELRRTAWSPADREVLLATGLVAVVVLAVLSWVRHYSGGGWSADWLEHLRRAVLWAEHGPADTEFFGFYTLAARPPLWNAYIGQVFTVLGPDYINNQLQVALAAALIVPPAWGLVRHCGGGTRSGWLVTLFIALNPSFLQNATFSWTRSPTVALTLGAVLWFARSRQSDAPGARPRRVLAFALLSAATFMHYSAGPWLVLLAGLHLWDRRHEWRRVVAWRELGGIALAGAVLLGPWVAWSVHTFGFGGATGATTTMMGASRTGLWGQLWTLGGNLFDTLVPWFFRLSWSAWEARPETWWGNLHDMTFITYQTNLWFAVGSVGAIVLLVDFWRRRQAAGPERGFWTVIALGGILLGLGVNGIREFWGLAHICLQPIIVLGLIALALRLPHWSTGWQRAVWVGFGLDVALGTLFHFGIESRNLLPYVAELSRDAFRAEFGVAAHANLYYKVTSLSLFFGDEMVLLRPLTLAAAVGAVALVLHRLRRSA